MTTTTTEGDISTQRKKPRRILHEVTNARNPKPPRLTAQFDMAVLA